MLIKRSGPTEGAGDLLGGDHHINTDECVLAQALHGYLTQLATERRYLSFRRRFDVAPVIAKWKNWNYPPGNMLAIVLQLTVASAAHARGALSRPCYDKMLRDLAERCRFPLSNFLIVAKCELECARYNLVYAGQIAFDPLRWDEEGVGE